jgi:hypothetical protein
MCARNALEVEMKRVWSSLLACALLLVLGHASVDASQDAAREVKVTATVANVRAQPAPSGKLLFQLKQGETARLVETAGDWHHVEDARGRRGYVLGTLVQVIEPPPPPPAPEPTPPPAAEPAPGPGPLTIDHKEIGCLVAEQYPKLDACFAPEENVGRAQIHFRALDSEPWYSVEMQKDGPCFAAYLPKPLRSTREVQYYVDVMDRSFAERSQPEGAPQGAYRARVVRKDGDCGGLARLAHAVGKVAKPIVVGVARTAAGAAADAAAVKLMGQLLLAGFRPEGVILAATGAAPAGAARASASGGSSGAGGAGGGGAAGGGIGMGTIAAVGGAVVAVGVGAAAAGGGGDDSGSSGGGGGGGGGGVTPTTASLTGRWGGQLTATVAVTDFQTSTCTYPNVALDLTHSGATLSGNIVYGSGQCSPALLDDLDTFVTEGGTNAVTGTASNNQITLNSPGGAGCPAAIYTGTYNASGTSFNTTLTWTCNVEGFTVRVTGTFNATKR